MEESGRGQEVWGMGSCSRTFTLEGWKVGLVAAASLGALL